MSREVWSVSVMPAVSTPHLAQDDVAEAAALLGERHALVRILRIRRALRDQAVVTLLLLIGTAGLVFLDESLGAAAAGAAGTVEAVLLGALVLCRQEERERCWDVIIQNGALLSVRAVTRERRRLLTEGERLARSLDRMLDVARRWSSTLPAQRPPAGYRHLAALPTEVERVVADLRSAPVSVAGVALIARLLAGGPNSVLSQGSVEDLRAELRRIHAHFDHALPT